MTNASERPADSIEEIIQTYGDLLFRLCYIMLGNETDAEDAVQETLLTFLKKAPSFENAGHEKAWLITTSKNKCRDMLRFRKRHPLTDPEALPEAETPPAPEPPDDGILEALMSLPEKYRLVLTLYYVEEYRIGEIAQMIGRTPSAVKMRLSKGRRLLEEKYREEYL